MNREREAGRQGGREAERQRSRESEREAERETERRIYVLSPSGIIKHSGVRLYATVWAARLVTPNWPAKKHTASQNHHSDIEKMPGMPRRRYLCRTNTHQYK